MREESRQAILDAALSLFAMRGIGGTRTGEIARRADVSAGLLYHYFSSKEEIFDTLVIHAFKKLNQACEELERMTAPPRVKLERAYTGLVHSLQERAENGYFYLLTVQASITDTASEAVRHCIETMAHTPYRVVADVIREMLPPSAPKDRPEKLSLLFWSTIKGLALYRASFSERFVAPDPELFMTLFSPM